MATRELTQSEYDATLAQPMANISDTGGPLMDVGPYLMEVPEADWQGFKKKSGIPDFVYLSPDKRYEHYLIPTTTPDVYLAIVADNQWKGFHGHRLLNFNKLYGLKTPPEQT